MKTIWKYQFRIEDQFSLAMPRGARVLHAEAQGGVPTLWALVDPDERKVPRTFAIFGTGHQIPDDHRSLVHVSTFQIGPFVWHLFDQG